MIIENLTFPEKPSWTKITVPSQWEHQGYHDYDGSAWYRKQFIVPKKLEGEDLVLLLGKIDDFDQTYLNGKLVGSTTWYDKLRIYHINSDVVNAGAVNLLMIYVDDPQGAGGIWEGPVGIMKQSEFTRFMRWREE
jgi:sialate O-acetylesterase